MFVITNLRKRAKPVHMKGEFMGRSYFDFDKNEFFRLLDNSPWDKFYENTDPKVLWNIFKKYIMDAADQTCPKKRLKIKKYKEPWISNGIL